MGYCPSMWHHVFSKMLTTQSVIWLCFVAYFPAWESPEYWVCPRIYDVYTHVYTSCIHVYTHVYMYCTYLFIVSEFSIWKILLSVLVLVAWNCNSQNQKNVCLYWHYQRRLSFSTDLKLLQYLTVFQFCTNSFIHWPSSIFTFDYY